MKICTLFVVREEVATPLPESAATLDPDIWFFAGFVPVGDDHEFGLSKDGRHFHLEGRIEKVEG